MAALGGEITVTMLDGQERQLVVPAGIQTGQKMRLSGQGMPALRDRKAGDAYARVKITVPRSLSDEERGLLNAACPTAQRPGEESSCLAACCLLQMRGARRIKSLFEHAANWQQRIQLTSNN